MNTQTLAMIFLASLLTACTDNNKASLEQLASENSADLIVLGISPNYSEAQGTEVLLSISDLLTRTKLGSTTIVVDALNCQRVAEFAVPADRAAFASEKARSKIFSGDLSKLRQFIVKGASGPDRTASVHVPRFLEMATEIASSKTGATSVLLIGSALHRDLEGTWSFRELRVPSDGTLKVSPLKCSFGTVGKEHFLSTMELHFVHLDDWESDAYRLAVHRFWHLFCQMQQEEAQGLITFTSDLNEGVDRLLTPDLKPLWSFEIDEKSTSLEMVPISPQVSAVPSKPLPVVSDTKQTGGKRQQVRSPVGLTRLGLRWKANIDLDLYVRTQSGEELFYDHRTCKSAYFHKDERHAPLDSRGFEHVVFSRPVDPKYLEIWVNHYRGRLAQRASAELVFEFHGKWYVKPLTLDSRTGNRGVNRDSERVAPHWIGPIKIGLP